MCIGPRSIFCSFVPRPRRSGNLLPEEIRAHFSGKSESVDFDLLFATGNVMHNQTASVVAKAWLKHGLEEYYFNNVAAGIHTPLDAAMWRRLSGKRWPEEYRDAVGLLRKQKAPRH